MVTLAEAREKALARRKIAREGGDPLAERRTAKAVVPTLAEAMERVHRDHGPSWRNEKHGKQWLASLRQYVLPELGDRRVDEIATPDILRVLSPIWLAKPVTALRILQRIGTVLDWAKASGYRSGENPVDGVKRGLPKQPERQGHHAAMPYAEVPAFIARLKTSTVGAIAKLAFEFMVLTAGRTNEVLGARWDEVDLEARTWTVPGTRMKSGKHHRVPLSPRAVEVLRQAKQFAGNSPYVFPGQRYGRPLADKALLNALRHMGVTATPHGFRSSFRDWAAEETSVAREAAEMALAHVVENKVEAAYRRRDLFEKRRGLMEQWAAYLAASGG